MALIKWGDEEEKDKDLFGNPIKTIASVQSGSWQPAPSGADAPALEEDNTPKINGGIFDQQVQQPQVQGSYLLSDEKAQVDARKRQRAIEIENARRQAAAQAQAAAQFREGNVQNSQGQPLNVDKVKQDEGWKKYYGDAFKQERDSLDFWGRLMDGGQASKRAEVMARNRYNNELLRQSYDDKGTVIDQNAADQSRKLAAYNSAFAQDNSTRGQILARAIGATNDNKSSGFWDRLKDTINAEKQMNIADTIFGVNDSQKTQLNDVTRLAGGLLQGLGTMPTIGAKELYEAGTGRGTDAQTGFEDNLTTGERIGRGVSGALNTVTPFVGGSGKTLDLLAGKVLNNTASVAEKTLLKRLVSGIAMPAIEQGGIGVAQAGGEYFGNGNTLLDENGDFDKKKLLEFTKQVGEAGAMAAAGGAILSGGVMGINHLRNGRTPTLDAGELAAIEMNNTNAGEAQLSGNRAANAEGAAIRALEEGAEFTPVREPVADGVAVPDDVTPVKDGNIPEQRPADVAPVRDVPSENIRIADPNAPVDYGNPDTPFTSQENDLLNQLNEQKSVGELSDAMTPLHEKLQAKKDSITQTPADVTPVADGVVKPVEPTPITGENTPVLPPEQVRALQESKAGKSQAEEAVINQELQQAENSKPAITGESSGIDEKVFNDATKSDNAKINEFNKLRESSGSDQNVYDTLMNYLESGGENEWLKSAAAYVGREHDGRGVPLKDVLDDIGAPLPTYGQAKGANLSDSHQALTKSIRDLEKSTGQKGLYKKIAESMKGMTEEEQVKFMGDAWNKMKNEGLLAKDFVNQQNGTTPENVKPVKELPQPKTKTELTPITDRSIPKVDSIPEGMSADAATPSVDAQNAKIDAAISVLDEPKEYINQVAEAISEPGKSPIKADDMRETLDMYGSKGDSALKERIATKYERLKEITNEMNKPQLENRKNLKEGGIEAGNTEITKSRSELQVERGRLEKDLAGDIKKLTAQTSGKARASMIYNNLKNYRKSNMLLGASNIERQAPQDILGLLNDFVKNPKLMGKALKTFPKEYIKSIHNAARDWAIPPKTISEIPKYVLGNAYESAMSLVGVEGAVRARTNAYRNVEARNILSKLGYDITKENIDKMSKMMGNEAELMAHTAAGVANFMTSNTQFKKASDAYNAYLDGNPLERTKFLDNVAKQSTVAAQIKQQLFKSDNPMAHIAAEAIDFVAPFVRTASNAFDTTFTQTLNPFSKTAADYILRSERSKGQNAFASAKNAAMDGAMIAGTVGLIGAGRIVYNNGDDVDKPRGISIKVDDTHYVPIRAAHVELAVATVYVATQMVKDINSGDFNASSVKDYMGILDNSLPYVDSLANTNRAIGSATSGDEGDNNYAAKSYGLNTAKSFVPASNNGVEPWMARNQGNSMDAKSTYNKDPAKWFGNILNNSYGRGGYLPVSRDAAGRARTSDSQGAFINKTINDPSTKEFNTRINDLVNYGKKNNLGKGTQDMFNTYPTDKNNNFKSVQDSITFLDATDGKPDNAKKLEKNKKLIDLASQIRDGFYGDTGSELLTLDGKTLKSDASVPNKAGTKNSKLPLSMASVRNAIAQTDLPKEESDKLYAISGQSTELYNQLKTKNISYEQYSAEKAKLGAQEASILSNSESYKKMAALFDELDKSGFFEADGLGSTKSGQTYLWNSLNALLASKGATPAANYPKDDKGFTPWGKGGGTGRSATNKPGDRGAQGIKWSPVGKRQMASVKAGKYTPVKISVKLGNEVRKDKSQNYTNRNF